MSNNQANDEILPTISGYVHSVSPVKMSQNNNKYFNAVMQVNRHDYHHTVVYATETHHILMLADRNKTPIKLQNARRKISKYTTPSLHYFCSSLY